MALIYVPFNAKHIDMATAVDVDVNPYTKQTKHYFYN